MALNVAESESWRARQTSRASRRREIEKVEKIHEDSFITPLSSNLKQPCDFDCATG
jgi:hypothetical protein